MATKVNGSSDLTKVTFNGTELSKITFNGVVVYEPKDYSDITNLSWDDIIDGANNYKFTSANLGQTKTLTINGVSYTVQIIGVNHDTLTSDTSKKANLTFQLKYLLAKTYPMDASLVTYPNWTGSSMRQSTLPTILTTIQTNIQNAIKSVIKLTTAGQKSTTVVETNDKLFLLSEIEISGEVSYSIAGEGTVYEYWSGKTATDRKKYLGEGGTSAIDYWERSPWNGGAYRFCAIYSDGTLTGQPSSFNSSNANGVSFAFCL